MAESQTSLNLKAIMDAGYLLERDIKDNGLVTLRATRHNEVCFFVKDAPNDETASAQLLEQVKSVS